MSDLIKRATLCTVFALCATLPVFASGSTATASAGATIVHRVSIGSAPQDVQEGEARVRFDSSSSEGPVAVSLQIDQQDGRSNRVIVASENRPVGEIASDSRGQLVGLTIHTY